MILKNRQICNEQFGFLPFLRIRTLLTIKYFLFSAMNEVQEEFGSFQTSSSKENEKVFNQPNLNIKTLPFPRISTLLTIKCFFCRAMNEVREEFGSFRTRTSKENEKVIFAVISGDFNTDNISPGFTILFILFYLINLNIALRSSILG